MKAKRYRKKIETCVTTRCGFCQPNCPVYSVEEMESFSARGRSLIALDFIEKGEVGERLKDVIYKCTTCGSCSKNCSDILEGDSYLDNVGLVEALREDLNELGCIPESHRNNAERILKNNTPYTADKKKINRQGKENLLFIGCTYRTKDTGVPEKLISILERLDIDFAVLKEEPCCGSYLRKTGQGKEYKENQKKLEEMRNYKKIITMCPGCEQTLKLNGFDTVHCLPLLDELLEGKELKKTGMKIFYHDPCHLVRQREWKDGELKKSDELMESPRSLLKKAGVEIAEHEKTKLDTFCCGSGGGVRAAYPELAGKIREKRIGQILEIGADIIVTACPFCEDNFRQDKRIRVYDVLDIIASSLEDESRTM